MYVTSSSTIELSFVRTNWTSETSSFVCSLVKTMLSRSNLASRSWCIHDIGLRHSHMARACVRAYVRVCVCLFVCMCVSTGRSRIALGETRIPISPRYYSGRVRIPITLRINRDPGPGCTTAYQTIHRHGGLVVKASAS